MIYLEHKAVKGEVTITSSREVRRHAREVEAANRGEKPMDEIKPIVDEPWALKFKNGLREIDAPGLLLLGFGWSLVNL